MVQPPGPPPPAQPPSNLGGSGTANPAAQIQWEIGVLAAYVALMPPPKSSIQNLLTDLQNLQSSGSGTPTQLLNMTNALINQINASNPGKINLPNFQYSTNYPSGSSFFPYSETLLAFIQAAEQAGLLTPAEYTAVYNNAMSFSENCGTLTGPQAATEINELIDNINYSGLDYEDLLPHLNG